MPRATVKPTLEAKVAGEPCSWPGGVLLSGWFRESVRSSYSLQTTTEDEQVHQDMQHTPSPGPGIWQNPWDTASEFHNRHRSPQIW